MKRIAVLLFVLFVLEVAASAETEVKVLKQGNGVLIYAVPDRAVDQCVVPAYFDFRVQVEGQAESSFNVPISSGDGACGFRLNLGRVLTFPVGDSAVSLEAVSDQGERGGVTSYIFRLPPPPPAKPARYVIKEIEYGE
ncbi:MAG: hypothetical protein GHCLOJNM_03056 [bacterium]|nr:hypothetical protein [bacterium]